MIVHTTIAAFIFKKNHDSQVPANSKTLGQKTKSNRQDDSNEPPISREFVVNRASNVVHLSLNAINNIHKNINDIIINIIKSDNV